ncbi:uncharacterized protein LOC110690320 [Chenopodium quinoa]|uniref:uncharacterized protein LOC110690320 n=1 Tax=Chenopodium quinoa TaxID=63459 RepID=UPI000B78BDA2|nr:uncharacterized protein LOC110690320 [Chenopodium quinoa]
MVSEYKCEEAFQLLKQKLVTALVLTLPDDSGMYDVHSDASKNGKANVVIDALSRKISHGLNTLIVADELCREMSKMNIKENQAEDVKLDRIREKIKQGKATYLKIHEDGSLRYKGRWCVPEKCEEVKRKLMEEGHNTPYSVHPRGDKLYKDLKKVYWWPIMKNKVAEFVQSSRNDAIWVVVDRLTKSVVFIPMKETWKMEQLAKDYIKNVVRLHGVPKDIVSDKDFRFLSKFLKNVQENFVTTLKVSTAFHPTTDRKTEITIQTLEDI